MKPVLLKILFSIIFIYSCQIHSNSNNIATNLSVNNINETNKLRNVYQLKQNDSIKKNNNKLLNIFLGLTFFTSILIIFDQLFIADTKNVFNLIEKPNLLDNRQSITITQEFQQKSYFFKPLQNKVQQNFLWVNYVMAANDTLWAYCSPPFKAKIFRNNSNDTDFTNLFGTKMACVFDNGYKIISKSIKSWPKSIGKKIGLIIECELDSAIRKDIYDKKIKEVGFDIFSNDEKKKYSIQMFPIDINYNSLLDKPKYNLTICSVLNKHTTFKKIEFYKYIVEWIEYYKMIGVEHFYLYEVKYFDKNQTIENNLINDLKKLNYIDEKLITFVKLELPFTYFDPIFQFVSINSCFKINEKISKYVLNIDLDEYIIPYGLPIENNLKLKKLTDTIIELEEEDLNPVHIKFICKYGGMCNDDFKKNMTCKELENYYPTYLSQHLCLAKNDRTAKVNELYREKYITKPSKVFFAYVHNIFVYKNLYINDSFIKIDDDKLSLNSTKKGSNKKINLNKWNCIHANRKPFPFYFPTNKIEINFLIDTLKGKVTERTKMNYSWPSLIDTKYKICNKNNKYWKEDLPVINLSRDLYNHTYKYIYND